MNTNDELDDLTSGLDDLDVEWQPAATDMESAGKPAWASHSCGAFWRNREAYSHCAACHLTFTSDSGFNEHRHGPFDGTRVCRTTAELAALGWTGKPGHVRNGEPTSTLWSMPAPAVSPWKKDTK